jgi:tubulin--tyrosine ligase
VSEGLKIEQYPIKMYCKLEDNYHLSNKKALFLNLRIYYEALGKNPFDALPVTFHVKTGLDDPEF